MKFLANPLAFGVHATHELWNDIVVESVSKHDAESASCSYHYSAHCIAMGVARGAGSALIFCGTLLLILVAGCLIIRFFQFLEEDAQECSARSTEENQVPTPRVQSPAEGFAEIDPAKGVGTKSRMACIPPTAVTTWESFFGSFSKSPANPQEQEVDDPKTSTQATSQQQTTAFMSTPPSSSQSMLPPPLIPGFESFRGDEVSTWTIPHQLCQALVLGTPIEVQGVPPLYARLARKGQHRHIEMGRAKNFDMVEAIIGPLTNHAASGLVAEIFGPDGNLYGSFVQRGNGFAVQHKSKPGNVLTLDPVKTAKGSFLEIAAEDGQPICLARLNDPNSPGVEIDADPDVDSFLLVSCVLASFVSRPELLGDTISYV